MKKSFKIFGIIIVAAMLVALLALAISADTPTYVARVDGVGYETEAATVEAIKEGSSVELLSDFQKNIDKSGTGFTVNLGEYSVPGFVSSTHKVIKEGSAVTLTPAAENEIFTISFEYGGISASAKAALGTALKAPSEFDVYPKLNAETKEYTVLSFTVDGGTVSQNVAAEPVVSTVPAVVILWTSDDGNRVIGTDYYMPGDKKSVPDFSGDDIADDISPDWYSYGRIGWNEADVLAAEAGLSVGGEYKIRAVMGRKAPDTIPGLKINLTLYSNYVLNFYVPEERTGVEDLVIATASDGSV